MNRKNGIDWGPVLDRVLEAVEEEARWLAPRAGGDERLQEALGLLKDFWRGGDEHYIALAGKLLRSLAAEEALEARSEALARLESVLRIAARVGRAFVVGLAA